MAKVVFAVYLATVLCLQFGLPRYGLLTDAPWYALESLPRIALQLGAVLVASLLTAWATPAAWRLVDRRVRDRWVSTAAALLLPMFAWLATLYPPANKPDIILINVDTLRADHLPLYGYARETSPHLARLAQKGTVYENVYSQSSWTSPSVASLFTGRRVDQHRTTGSHPLRRREVTLAERLRGRGYRTAMVSANAIVSSLFAMDQGFGAAIVIDEDTTNRLAEEVTAEGLRILSEPRRRPLFLYLHYMDPHDPYDPPEPYRSTFGDPTKPSTHPAYAEGRVPDDLFEIPQRRADRIPDEDMRTLVSLYDGCILYVDAQLGRIVEAIEASANHRETIVIVTGDHGEAFGERGDVYHGNNLHAEEVSPPLLIARLGDRDGGLRDDRPVQSIDITRTVLEMCGVPVPRKLPGQDLSRTEGQRTDTPIRIDLAWSDRDQVALVQGGYKLIFTYPGDVRLYDTIADPFELHDLWERGEPNSRQQGQAMLDSIIKMEEDRSSWRPLGDGMDAARIEQLKALGYVDENGQPLH